MHNRPRFTESTITGLFLIELDHRADVRGWFEEVWQKEKWTGTQLSNFYPVQHNASSNLKAGSTRGLHAEPWNKLVTVVAGRAFCAWVDLREGDDFGKEFHTEVVPGQAYFIPKGVANGYQSMEDGTVYTYLVDKHWSPFLSYPSVDAFDPVIAIPWPFERKKALLSEEDSANPPIGKVSFFSAPKTIVLGPTGQVGRALVQLIPNAEISNRGENLELLAKDFDFAINAAAFTRVDAAEQEPNRDELFFVNHELVSRLSKLTEKTGATIVHYSSDYVFDGSKPGKWTEDDFPNPISKYGLSKLLGDYAAAKNPRHYIIRTSWVYGEGHNFIRTMFEKASSNEQVSVVSDQVGRPTSAIELGKFTKYLIESQQPYGTYNFSGSGDPVSWHELAKFVYEYAGANLDLVRPITSAEYVFGRTNLAHRPANSVLCLSKTIKSGYSPPNWRDSLIIYLESL